MEAKIQKQIIDYFSYFDEFHTAAKTSLKDCQNCAASINKLIKRCKNIKETNVTGTPLEEFEGLQSKLCASIHNLISEDVLDIRSKLGSLEELLDKLCNKNKTLRDTCRETDLEENSALVKGTPLQPPLKQLLEFADDTVTFGSQVVAQINTSLNILTYKELDTEPLGDNLRYPANWQRRITEILSYTSFVSENQI
ncbi:unnamed protein product [Chrysodeixis includens]|uniref:Uncharacterized protein n=1 Tax=Chrysodeixis includens TaxID=689277 RepID=A0A9N8PZ34_CHRIL|nr:unnamed protein product [Chrysodeixis includens]